MASRGFRLAVAACFGLLLALALPAVGLGEEYLPDVIDGGTYVVFDYDGVANTVNPDAGLVIGGGKSEAELVVFSGGHLVNNLPLPVDTETPGGGDEGNQDELETEPEAFVNFLALDLGDEPLEGRAAETHQGITVTRSGVLRFAAGSIYSGDGPVRVLSTDADLLENEKPEMIIREDVYGLDANDSLMKGLGLKQLFANTSLGANGIVYMGGAEFTQDLALAADSAGGSVVIDEEAAFLGGLDLAGSALRVEADTSFYGDITAAEGITLDNATMRLAGNQTVAGGFTADGGGVLNLFNYLEQEAFLATTPNPDPIRGNTVHATGGMAFRRGSVLEMGAGVLNVDDITFASGSTYKATVESGLNHSSIVADRATIEDGVRLVVVARNANDVAGVSFLTATDLATANTFTSDVYNLALVDGEVVVTGTKTIVNPITTPGGGGRNMTNGIAFLNRGGIDGTNVATKWQEATALYASSDPATKKRGEVAIRQVLGLYLANQSAASVESSRRFNTGVGGRITALHDNAQAARNAPAASSRPAGPASSGFPSGPGGPDGPEIIYPRADTVQFDGAYPSLAHVLTECPTEQVDRLWLGGYGGWTSQKDKDFDDGYKYRSHGLIGGYDWQKGDLTIGVSGAFGSGRFKNNDGDSKIDADTLNIGLYAAWDPVCGIFADASVGYGRAWNDMRTSMASGGDTYGKYGTSSFGLGGNVGYVFSMADDTLRITPTVGFQWTGVYQDAWTERSSDASQVLRHTGKSEADYVEIPLAVRVNKAIQLSNGSILTPEVRAAYIVEAGDTSPVVQMKYVGSGTTSFLHGVDSGKGRGLVGGGVKANINSSLDAFVDYNLEFRSGYRNSSLTTGMGLSF